MGREELQYREDHLPHKDEEGSPIIIPQFFHVPHDTVRTEVIAKGGDVIVHLFPHNPQLLNKVFQACEKLLPKRFPGVHGRVETIVAEDKDWKLDPSVCITAPRDELPSWAFHYFQAEFPRLIASELS